MPTNRYRDPSKPHHRSDGFQNRHAELTPESLADALRWRWDAARHGLPRPPREPIPQVAPELSFLATKSCSRRAMQPTATWMGHATVMAQLGGFTLLTDPIFSPRASPVSVDALNRQPAGHRSSSCRSARGLNDQMATLWGGLAVFADDCHLFYAGDTGYSRDFSDSREHLAERHGLSQGGGCDLALLPIGAYEPRWFMSAQHVNVEDVGEDPS